MLKKTLATALLALSLPAIANAWFFSTQAKSAGGTIDTPNKIGQIVTDGAINKSYPQTDVADKSVTVTADSGFIIKYVTVGGVTTTAPASPFTVIYPGSASDKSVTALFTANTYTASARIAGGNVSPSSIGNLYQGYVVKKPLVFTFSPKTGYYIAALTGVPAGATADAVPAAVNARVKVTFPVGYTFTSSVALEATTFNATPALSTILPQTVVAGTSGVKLTAAVNSAYVGTPSYSWSYLSGPKNTVAVSTDSNGKVISTVTPGPALTLATPAQASTTFTAPSVPGQYIFQVAVGSLKTSATVNVVATAADSSNQCRFCHSANGISDPTAGVVAAASNSHSACQTCHFTGAGHPGTVNAATIDRSSFLVKSDNVANGNGAAAAKGTNFCASCHGTSGNAAQAVPALTVHQNKACSNCHASAHDTHVASATCSGCHATVNNHNAVTMGTKVCLDCHNGHSPATGTSPFLGPVSVHPAVTLYTFEEIAMQMNNGQPVPVQVDANGKGMPYSPKQTCGTANCHVKNGVDYTYDKISDHAFHSGQGRSEYQDSSDGKFNALKNKPWLQSTAMVGKW
jgi:hypothetical protein